MPVCADVHLGTAAADVHTGVLDHDIGASRGDEGYVNIAVGYVFVSPRRAVLYDEVTKGRRVEVAFEDDNEIHESEGRVVGVDEFLLLMISCIPLGVGMSRMVAFL